MEIFFSLLGLLGIFLFVTAVIMPWVNHQSIRRLEDEVSALRRSLSVVKKDPAPAQTPSRIETTPPPMPVTRPEPKPEPVATPKPVPHRPAVTTSVAPKKKTAGDKKESFESKFGARLPIWGGGIALALSGFFLVKYSIEIGLLTPAVRVILGTLFGFVLMAGAEAVRRRPGFANGPRIAQALAGAGVADLYGCIYAAVNMYHFISPGFGFAAMALVTVAAVVLAVLHGPPVALLGMAGGFLTPALMHMGDPSAPALFSYLFFLVAGLVAVAAWQRWWITLSLTLAGGFLWVVAWLGSGYMSGLDGVVIGLYLLACCAAVFTLTARLCGAEEKPVERINGASAAAALALMGAVAVQAHFGLGEWMLMGLLSAGTLALAYLKPASYRALPWLGLGGTVFIYALWPVSQGAEATMIAQVLLPWCWGGLGTCVASSHVVVALLLGAMHLGAAFLLRRTPLFAAQGAVGPFAFLALAWFKLRYIYVAAWPWTLVAFALAGLAIIALAKTREDADEAGEKSPLLAVYAAAAAGFTATALFIQTPGEFLSVALAAEVFALAWIYTRLPDVTALRRISAVTAGAFCIALARQAVVMAAVVTYSLFEARIPNTGTLPVMEWPLFQLGLPALFFLGAAWLFRKDKDDALVHAFEIGAVALAGLAAYYTSRNLLHPGENTLYIDVGFTERGVLTSVFFAAGLLCLHAGRKYGRAAVAYSGLALSGMAAFRLVWFDFLIHNPLFDGTQRVGEAFLFNGVLVTYGLPVLFLGLIAKFLPLLGKEGWTRALRALMLVSSFAFVTYEVRQAFHGSNLDYGATGNAEIYTYSAAWALFGLALLVLGTLRKERALRLAALGIMALTAGKVFLYDAAALEGLYRVFSFLGLGLSLMGLGWFTARFVLPREEVE